MHVYGNRMGVTWVARWDVANRYNPVAVIINAIEFVSAYVNDGIDPVRVSGVGRIGVVYKSWVAIKVIIHVERHGGVVGGVDAG